ncbi:MAG: type II secretion system F family protein [Candidatus Nezhaarchaeales archaeon]
MKRFSRRRGRVEAGAKGFHAFAFRVLGGRVSWLEAQLTGLDDALRKAGMRITLRAYVSLMVLLSFLAATTTFVSSYFILDLFIKVLTQKILLSFGFSLIVWVVVFYASYIYPKGVASTRRRYMEVELPFVVSHMAVLAAAGITPERIFKSLADLNIKAISDEARNIIRDVELFGYDVLEAISRAAKRSPSSGFAEVLRGVVSTSSAGGDLKRYLLTEARRFMRLKRIEIRRSITSLSVVSEVYIGGAVIGPLILILMLSMMSLVGAAVFGLSLELIMMIVVYVLTPAILVIMLILMDAFMVKV